METGFLNPIHDEEHFQSTFYNQGTGLNETDVMLFGELIVPEVIDFDNLWHSVDDTGTAYQSGEQATRKEDFQRMYIECQQQLNYMQESEAIKQIISVAEKTTKEVSEMFDDRPETTSTPSAPSIDELFPLECNKESYLEEAEERSKDYVDETFLHVQVKKEVSHVANESCTKDPLDITEDTEEVNVDVETVEPETPLLLAGDLTSLLEQFEATEKVNLSQASQLPPSPARPSNQTIRDALPVEVINRIKATRESHKKIISVIPAIPSKRPGRTATRMQDAGVALSRNKFLKLITGGSSGESVQLDHDYCTSGDTASVSSKSFYMSDSSEYPSQSSTPETSYSRLPEFYVSQISNKARADPGSRKDSGLESGENSDEDIQSIKEIKNTVVLKSRPNVKTVNEVTENYGVIGSAPDIKKNIPMMSVLRKNVKIENNEKAENSNVIAQSSSVASSTQVDFIVTQDAGKKKKKLNLEEYRVRREERERFRSQESSRANSPNSCCTPPAQLVSTTVLQEGISKEKPVMLSVEVQTQTCDFIDLTSSKSLTNHENSQIDRKDKRNNPKHRSYRSRHSSSSSSSSVDSDHRRSHRRKRRSRSNKRRRSSVSRMWSRSPSRSPSSNSLSSSRSRSRSHGRRQKWRSRSPPRKNHIARYSNSKGFHRRDTQWHSSRVRSPVRPSHVQDFGNQEKVRQVEERRVIYVGRIDEGTSKADLRRRFQGFGPIVDISVHFRERGDNYGFVTFAYKADAYKAVEHGNDDPKQPRYDLCFGGRRAFCKQRYADLDGIATTVHDQYGVPAPQHRSNESFDLLLHEVKAQLRKRSSD